LVAAGCGGDDGVNVGGLSCNTAPCGGDPVGAWTIGATCITGIPTIDACPEADIRVAVDQTGTVDVSADMTYSVEVTSSGFIRTTFPASCLEGVIADCADIGDGVELTCTGDATVECSCEQILDETATESGTWSVSGNQINLDDGTDVTIGDYCVDGDAMSVRTGDADGLAFELLMTR
jgi:hypothetical protein